MHNVITAHIRTLTPALAGALLSWLATHGLELDSEATAGLIAFLTALFTALYHLIVSIVAQKWPKASLLLGSSKQPHYTTQSKS